MSDVGEDGYKFGGLSGFTGIADRIFWQIDEIKRLRSALKETREHLHIAMNAGRPADRETATLDAYDTIAAALLTSGERSE